MSVPPDRARGRTRRGAVARAVEALRTQGWRVFGLKLAGELGYRRLVLLERMLDIPLPEPAPSQRLEFALLNAAHVDDYLDFRPEAARAQVLALLAEGCLCFVARHDGSIVSAAWSRMHDAGSGWVDYVLPLASGDVYSFDAYTQDAYRGRGIAHALCLFQLRHLQRMGFRRALRGTIPENTAALRAHAKSGFRPIAMVTRYPWRRTVRRAWNR